MPASIWKPEGERFHTSHSPVLLEVELPAHQAALRLTAAFYPRARRGLAGKCCCHFALHGDGISGETLLCAIICARMRSLDNETHS